MSKTSFNQKGGKYRRRLILPFRPTTAKPGFRRYFPIALLQEDMQSACTRFLVSLSLDRNKSKR